MLDIRRIHFILFAAVFLLTGCRESKSAESAPAQHPALPVSMPTIARVHWLGMKQLSGETDAAHLMTIWNLPESGRLERQTLDKLSLAPWRLLHRDLNTNVAALLRPLLDDLVADESYLEIRQATNPSGELVLAIRLDDQRAALWQTNLAAVLESLTGIRPDPTAGNRYGWSLKKHHDPNFLELTRAGGWTLVGAARDHNSLLDDLRARIQHSQAPWTTGNTKDWLTADLDPAQLIPSLATFNSQLSTLNHFHLAVSGDNTNVLVNGTVDFPQPLALDLKPWNVPTNLVNWDPSSFTVIRGFRPWLEPLPAWKKLQIGPPPDQVCFWAVRGLQMQSYFAAPLADASNEVDRFSDWVLQNQSRWYVTNELARFVRPKAYNGLDWKGLPYMKPFVCSTIANDQNFVYGGSFPNSSVYLLSVNWLQRVLARTNLVYYDTELTGPRVQQWLYMSQFIRVILHRVQLPSNSQGLLWLKTVAPGFGNSVTVITRSGPNQLTFTRTSSVGFTAVELNLLADWLESPQFPVGLHSLDVSPGELNEPFGSP